MLLTHGAAHSPGQRDTTGSRIRAPVGCGMSNDTSTAATTGTAAPSTVTVAEQAERVPWLRGVAWPLARRTAIALWRHLLTLYVLTRLGLVWAAFCAATGLADTHTRVERDSGKTTTRVRHVPRLDHVDAGPHGATLRVKLHPGQDLRTLSLIHISEPTRPY